MTSFSPRSVVVYSLPLSNDVVVHRPEQLVFDFGEKGSLDIGALCYVRRDFETKRHFKNDGKLVDLSSLDSRRVKLIWSVIDHIVDESKGGRKRLTTIYGYISKGIVDFFNWADKNGFSDACYDKECARKAFMEIDKHWRERERHGEVNSITASRAVRAVMWFMNTILGFDDIHCGIDMVRRDNRDSIVTEPPGESVQGKVLGLCNALFNGLVELLLNGGRYPFRIEMPKYLGWEKNEIWLFPVKVWCRAIHKKIGGNENERPYYAYDYKNGRVADFYDLAPVIGASSAKAAIKDAIGNINRSNIDPGHYSRRHMGVVSHNAFVLMFMANTGMNFAQVRDLTWSDDYDVSVSRQGFRVVKWRAGGLKQSFEIQGVFLPVFKKYLMIRAHILGEREFPRLFLNLGVGHLRQPKPIEDTLLNNFYKTLRKIDPALPKVTLRQWRAAKSDWLLRKKVSVPLTATILQNSESTVLTSYAAGSQETHFEEMSKFLGLVSSTVVDRNQTIEHGLDSPVGNCVDYGVPEQLFDGAPKAPDCRNPEGCLFCNKHKVHADERDTRKLVSCRYCIQRIAQLANSVEHFDSVFGRILERIQALLDEIRKRTSSGMVEAIEYSVEMEGDLDNYWARKYDLLIHLELISA